MSANPILYCTLVSGGGTPIRIADQSGAPYPTTGKGALVFSKQPQLEGTVTITGDLAYTGRLTGPYASPLTTRGDLYYYGGAGNTRLPLGPSGTVLTSNGADARWILPGALAGFLPLSGGTLTGPLVYNAPANAPDQKKFTTFVDPGGDFFIQSLTDADEAQWTWKFKREARAGYTNIPGWLQIEPPLNAATSDPLLQESPIVSFYSPKAAVDQRWWHIWASSTNPDLLLLEATADDLVTTSALWTFNRADGAMVLPGPLTGTAATFIGADSDLLGLFSGTTMGVRIVTDASGARIEGVDNTGVGSYQPLTLNGTVVNAPTPAPESDNDNIATTAWVRVNVSSDVAGLYLPLTGGTLTGALGIGRAPTALLDAAGNVSGTSTVIFANTNGGPISSQFIQQDSGSIRVTRELSFLIGLGTLVERGVGVTVRESNFDAQFFGNSDGSLNQFGIVNQQAIFYGTTSGQTRVQAQASAPDLTITLPASTGTLALTTQIPTTLPPNGTAGGDLSGTYPNPTIKPSLTNGQVLTTVAGVTAWATPVGGTGTVTGVSVVSANGFAGTATATATPAITLTTTITGMLKGNGTAISAAVANTDYLPVASPTFTGTLTGGAFSGTTGAFSATITSTLGTITTSQPAFSATQTWNAGAVTFEAFKVNVTRTAAADPSYVMRLQVGGSDVHSVDRFGTGIFTAQGFFGGQLNIDTGNAITAGGNTNHGLGMSTTQTFGLYYGSGAPTISQARGSLYLRSDGVPYYNTNGTTGWDSLVATATLTAGYQPLDATLTSLAAYNTNGLLTQTAADTFTGRTITGTASRLAVTNGSGVAGNPTLDIDSAYVGQATITTLGTIATGTWQGSVIAGQYGGTGIANTGKTITLGGNLTTSGAFASTFTMTGTTTVTFPTSGTLATTSQLTAGTVTGVSVVSANGFAGTATATATPAITLTTTITGLLKGNATAISAATAGTDYISPSATAGITAGYTYTAFNIGTPTNGSTTTLAGANGNYQYLTNNVAAFTIAAPAADTAISLLITNGATAGTITFTGFTVSAATGDALTTTNTSKFLLSIVRINAISTYMIKALQ